jgi:hypothetical protein
MTDKPEDKTITREKKTHSIKKSGHQKSYSKGDRRLWTVYFCGSETRAD